MFLKGSAIQGRPPRESAIEGDTFTELVGAWNALHGFSELGDQEPRERLAPSSPDLHHLPSSRHVKDAAGKTYIAALGAALLAKASEPGVDSLTRRQEAGPPSAAGRCSTAACGMDGRSVMALPRGSGGAVTLLRRARRRSGPAGRDLPGARGVRVLRPDHRPLQLQNLHPTSDPIAKPLEARLTLLRECAGIAGRDPAPIGSSFCE